VILDCALGGRAWRSGKTSTCGLAAPGSNQPPCTARERLLENTHVALPQTPPRVGAISTGYALDCALDEVKSVINCARVK
jgi:hypothetical protein